MSDFGDLSKNLREHGDAILVNQNKKTIRVALAIDSYIVQAMPVKIGRAKSSVILTLDEPTNVQTTEAYFPGKNGSTAGQNAQAAIDQAENAIRNREYGQEIYININIPYIDALNKGHSPQADPGFLEQAVQNGISSEVGIEAELFKRQV